MTWNRVSNDNAGNIFSSNQIFPPDPYRRIGANVIQMHQAVTLSCREGLGGVREEGLEGPVPATKQRAPHGCAGAEGLPRSWRRPGLTPSWTGPFSLINPRGGFRKTMNIRRIWDQNTHPLYLVMPPICKLKGEQAGMGNVANTRGGRGGALSRSPPPNL